MDTLGFFEMRIRPATLDDFEEAYALGKNTPELKVSSTEEFMDRDDFQQRIGDPLHVFLIAEQKKRIIGFICANTKDLDSPLQNKYACLVYLVTLPKFRRQGVAKKLYIECERQLRERGIHCSYNPEMSMIHRSPELDSEIIKRWVQYGEGRRRRFKDSTLPEKINGLFTPILFDLSKSVGYNVVVGLCLASRWYGWIKSSLIENDR